jgi:DNA ligase 1
MRFPRINRLRWDKPPRDADRLETLEALLDHGAAADANQSAALILPAGNVVK